MSTRSRRSVSRSSAQPEPQRRRVASKEQDTFEADAEMEARAEALFANASSDSHASATVFDTPLRQAREDEAHQIELLNKRLQYYILIMREREEMVLKDRAELIKLRKGNAVEVLNVRNEYEARISAIREEYETTRDDKAVRIEMKRLTRKIEELSTSIQRAKEDTASAEDRLAARNEQLGAAQSDNALLKEEIRRLNAELAAEKARHAQTAGLLDSARGEVTNVSKLYAEEQATSAALNTRLTSAGKELTKLRAQYDEVSRDYNATETSKVERERELRASYAAQLSAMVDEVRARCLEDVAEAKAAADERWGAEVAAVEQERDKALAELAATKSKGRDGDSVAVTLRNQVTMLNARVSTLETDNETLTVEVTEVRKELEQKANDVDTFRRALRECEEDREMLISVKIGIGSEIVRYRELLEKEEILLSQAGMAAVPISDRTPSQAYGDNTNNIVFLSSMVTDNVIRLKNGHIDAINLKNFILKTKKTAFKFPDVTAEADGVIAVYVGKDAVKRAAADKTNSIALPIPGCVIERDDFAALSDSAGREVCRVNLIKSA